MRFRTKTEWFLWAAVGFVFLIYLGVGFLMYLPNGDVSAFYGLAIIWLFLALFLLWILPKTTHYTFLDDHLLCQSVGIKKRIYYETFKKIEPSNGLYAGWKMSTAWKCLVLHYNKYDELLISPAKEEEFIKMFDEKKAQFSELN
jgi:hypothetical protein